MSSPPSEDGSSCIASPHSLLLLPGLGPLMDMLAHSVCSSLRISQPSPQPSTLGGHEQGKVAQGLMLTRAPCRNPSKHLLYQ